MHGYGYGWMPGYGHGMGLVMVALWLVLIIIVAISVVWLLRSTLASRGALPPPRSALQILEERYARGEIEREEFLAKRKDLQP